MPYTSTGEALGEGFKSGINLVAGLSEMKEKKRAREWEKDLSFMKTGMEAASIKGISNDTKMKVLTNIGGTYKKWFGQNPFENLSAEQLPNHDAVIKQGNDLISAAQKDPKKAGFVLGELQKIFTEHRGKISKDKEQLDTFNTVVKGQEDFLGKAMDAETKKENKTPIKPDLNPAQALERQTTLVDKMSKASQGIYFDQSTGQTMDLNKNPELKKTVIRQYLHESNEVNKYLPKDQQKVRISKTEFDEAEKSGAFKDPMARQKLDGLLKSGRYIIMNDL